MQATMNHANRKRNSSFFIRMARGYASNTAIPCFFRASKNFFRFFPGSVFLPLSDLAPDTLLSVWFETNGKAVIPNEELMTPSAMRALDKA
jgi:hypothetical protein